MPESFAYHISLLKKQFSDFCNHRLQDMGLTQGLLFVVIYVGKRPGCSPKELICALQLDTGYATRVLARLTQSGFLQQTQNPKDRRSHILTLTERGKEAFLSSYDLFSEWDQTALQALSQEEQVQLLSLLGRLSSGKENPFATSNDR